jgi:putative permease
MQQIISDWFKRYFSDPQAVTLFLTLIFAITVIALMGQILAPILVSIVIAYLLQGVVTQLQRWRCPKLLAIILVLVVTLGLILFALIGLFPLLGDQLSNLINELPNMVNKSESLLQSLPQDYPGYISATQINTVLTEFKHGLTEFGKIALSVSISSIPGIIAVVIYAVLVPLLVFFFLKDSQQIIQWLSRFLPKQRQVLNSIWHEVNQQIGNYIRGKITEMLLVGIVSAITFAIMGLQYALLLGVLVGVSVLIPYIGAIVVTVPIVIVSIWQWGFTMPFVYLMIAYAIIITLDANILVPLLFSEAMKLHPVAIIVAVFVFGGLLGFWGIFFAIPLATVVKAVINKWPTTDATTSS